MCGPRRRGKRVRWLSASASRESSNSARTSVSLHNLISPGFGSSTGSSPRSENVIEVAPISEERRLDRLALKAASGNSIS